MRYAGESDLAATQPRARSRSRSAFRLAKWYLDCTTSRGEALIAYRARLTWGGLALDYTSVLESRRDAPAHVVTSLRPGPAPQLQGALVTWEGGPLKVSGQWAALQPAAGATFLESEAGRVAWRCHQPLARATVRTPRGTWDGLGYVEHLEVGFAPWRLPIDELHWGRFLSPGASLVWVDWRGPHQRRLVLLDGAEVAGAAVDEAGVRAPGLELSLHDPQVLRRGALGRTALALVPRLDALFPARLLATDETKWCSRGVLVRGGERLEGQVIHEVVRWPPR
jgi:hypothetical protein